ncbi:hypothetical protein B9Z55_010406 [Caenorhabditis nigoni]|uniref:Uncharacterized protein n=1 Tax=Caenorhabditis nigoni TaxID=1611254 RepID=A0A2G5UFP2_9PELO|nr:hypothetical protein B9Z55_010406 [Caenorhabditis nigoni]
MAERIQDQQEINRRKETTPTSSRIQHHRNTPPRKVQLKTKFQLSKDPGKPLLSVTKSDPSQGQRWNCSSSQEAA